MRKKIDAAKLQPNLGCVSLARRKMLEFVMRGTPVDVVKDGQKAMAAYNRTLRICCLDLITTFVSKLVKPWGSQLGVPTKEANCPMVGLAVGRGPLG